MTPWVAIEVQTGQWQIGYFTRRGWKVRCTETDPTVAHATVNDLNTKGRNA